MRLPIDVAARMPDPLGSGQQAYEDVALQIERLLPAVVDDIAVSLGGS